jgi:DNA-binding transcriptional MerR regulator
LIVVGPSIVEEERKGPAIRKLYYSIGEVTELTGVAAHVLRYWESEFPQLRPKKGRSGNRTYQAKDIDLIGRIKTLLYDQRFTIAGARVKLSNGHVVEEANGNGDDPDIKVFLCKELREILHLLEPSSGRGAAR